MRTLHHSGCGYEILRQSSTKQTLFTASDLFQAIGAVQALDFWESLWAAVIVVELQQGQCTLKHSTFKRHKRDKCVIPRFHMLDVRDLRYYWGWFKGLMMKNMIHVRTGPILYWTQQSCKTLETKTQMKFKNVFSVVFGSLFKCGTISLCVVRSLNYFFAHQSLSRSIRKTLFRRNVNW